MILPDRKEKTVSYCIFTYNQEKYISKAMESAFNQTYSPLEIIISDDYSTDNTYKIAEQLVREYKGEHKIILNRNKKNLGIGAHFSKVYYSIATGEYIIGLGGDDLAKAEHASYAASKMEEYKNVNLIDFSAIYIDQNGKFLKKTDLKYTTKRFSLDDYLRLTGIQSFAPGRIIRRSLLDSFNPISINCPTEDSVLVLRSLLTDGFLRINEPLIYYRKHDSNISSSAGLSRMSNHGILSQYLKDVLHFYDNGFINEVQLEKLIKRLNLELALRKLRFSSTRKGGLALLIKRVKMKWLTYQYKLDIF